jgi:hypothetical protein
VPITFNGGDQATEAGDALTIIGNSEQMVTALPSATSAGAGVLTIGESGVVNFTGLEPVNVNGGASFTVTFPNGDDVILIDRQGNNLVVSGTSGNVPFEEFRLRNVTTVTVDTTTNAAGPDTTLTDGAADVVTIADLTNSHGNTNLIVTTGTGGGLNEQIDITGPATFSGNVTLTSARINSNGLLTAGTSSTVTLTANVGNITDGNGASVNVSAGNLVASAVTGIGTADALETSVTNLEASGGTGGVNIADASNLVIGGIGATTGVSATGGNITITTKGALAVNEAVTNTGGGNITLTAGPTGGPGAGTASDDLVLNANVQASGGNGNVVLNAANDIGQNGTVAAAGVGALDYNAGTDTSNGVISMGSAAVASTPTGWSPWTPTATSPSPASALARRSSPQRPARSSTPTARQTTLRQPRRCCLRRWASGRATRSKPALRISRRPAARAASTSPIPAT